MNQIRRFVQKYLAEYLAESRMSNPFLQESQRTCIPPTDEEVIALISYLLKFDEDLVILGSVAVIKHMKITREEIHSRFFRPAQKLELFVSKELPAPPNGWSSDRRFEGCGSWTSPRGGVVEFLTLEDIFPGADGNQKIGKDPESVAVGCPLADVPTIFKINLNSDQERDLLDLLNLACKVGIPTDLDALLWNPQQKKRLELVKLWLKNRRNHWT